jgi:hypothetical protein
MFSNFELIEVPMGLFDCRCMLTGVSLMSVSATLVLLKSKNDHYYPIALPIKGEYNRKGYICGEQIDINIHLILKFFLQKISTGDLTIDKPEICIEEDVSIQSLGQILTGFERNMNNNHNTALLNNERVEFALISRSVWDAVYYSIGRDNTALEAQFKDIFNNGLIADEIYQNHLTEVAQDIHELWVVDGCLRSRGVAWRPTEATGQHTPEEMTEFLREAINIFHDYLPILEGLGDYESEVSDVIECSRNNPVHSRQTDSRSYLSCDELIHRLQGDPPSSLTLSYLRYEIFGHYGQDEVWHETLFNLYRSLPEDYCIDIVHYLICSPLTQDKIPNEHSSFYNAIPKASLNHWLLLTDCLAHSLHVETSAIHTEFKVLNQQLQAVLHQALMNGGCGYSYKCNYTYCDEYRSEDNDLTDLIEYIGTRQNGSSTSQTKNALFHLLDLLLLRKETFLSNRRQKEIQQWEDQVIASRVTAEGYLRAVIFALEKTSSSEYIDIQKIEIIIDIWVGDLGIFELLKLTLQRSVWILDDISNLIGKITHSWRDCSEVPFWLENIINDDIDFPASIRMVALRKLSEGWPDLENTQEVLRRRLDYDHEEEVKIVALEALAKGTSAPLTLDYLYRIIKFESIEVALAALDALLTLVPSTSITPELLPVFMEYQRRTPQLDQSQLMTKVEENVEKCHFLIYSLIRSWQTDEGTLEWLKEMAEFHESAEVRCAAIGAVAVQWREHPLTLPWLRSRSQSPKDVFGSLAAIKALIISWPNQPEQWGHCYLFPESA